MRDTPYSICYTRRDEADSPFRNIEVKTEGAATYISAKYSDGQTCRDRLSAIDAKRLTDGEISLPQLAYKYFAYLL